MTKVRHDIDVRGIITAHHAVYIETNVLHRDISCSNILFYYDSTTRHGVKGVLCDWEHAQRSGQPGNEVIMRDLLLSRMSLQQLSRYGYEDVGPLKAEPLSVSDHPSGVAVAVDKAIAGTAPFMALDLLLYNQPPTHLYRHDLESFYWVLVWFTAVFEPEKNKLGVLPEFQENDLRNVGYRKGQYLDDPFVRKLIRERGDVKKGLEVKSYRGLNVWVDRLHRDLMYPVYTKYKEFETTLCTKLVEAQAAEEQASVEETTSEAVDDGEPFAGLEDEEAPSVKDVIAEIRHLMEEREAIVTYEAFMACLKADP